MSRGCNTHISTEIQKIHSVVLVLRKTADMCIACSILGSDHFPVSKIAQPEGVRIGLAKSLGLLQK